MLDLQSLYLISILTKMMYIYIIYHLSCLLKFYTLINFEMQLIWKSYLLMFHRHRPFDISIWMGRDVKLTINLPD